MPTPEAVTREELASAGTRQPHQMLEVGCRTGRGADRDRAKRPVPHCEGKQRGDTRPELEAPVRDVVVRHPVTGDVSEHPERDSPGARGCGRARRGAGCDVQRDDHRAGRASCSMAIRSRPYETVADLRRGSVSIRSMAALGRRDDG